MNFNKVTAFLDSLKDQYNVRSTDCIILINHQPVFRHLTGTSDFAETIPLTENNLHDVFSASKVLTMIAVMQLVEKGRIGLNNELVKFLPEFADTKVLVDFDLTDFVASFKWLKGWPGEEAPQKRPENKILIQDMMSMTAGFSYQIGSPAVLALLAKNPHATTREIVRAFAKSPLLYEPGTRYAYSLAHDILAAVVEVVSGLKFSEYMQKYIFAPLGAKDIYYQIPASEKARLSVLYGRDANGSLIPVTENIARINDTYESGGGGVCCSVADYAKVIDALANDGVGATGARILQPESIAEMSRNRLNEQQLKDFHIGGKHEYGYALGVRTLLDTTKSKSPLGEFGWDGASGAYVLIDPKNHLALFYVQEAPESGVAFSTIHPTLRDLVYEVI